MELHATDGFGFKGWMVTELHLQGAELLTFALVHQFAQSGAGLYKGNTAYLSAWTGWTDKTCRTHLSALVEKGLIAEVRGRDNNTPFCYYQLAPDFYQKHPVKITGSPGKNFQSTPQNFPKAPGKNYREKDTIKIDTSEGTFFPPTPQAVADYCRGRGFADPEGFADYFLEICSNNGWRRANGKGEPITNWKNYIVSSWERHHKQKTYPRPQAPAPAAIAISYDSLNSMLR